jgi:hypothetical protein
VLATLPGAVNLIRIAAKDYPGVVLEKDEYIVLEGGWNLSFDGPGLLPTATIGERLEVRGGTIELDRVTID